MKKSRLVARIDVKNEFAIKGIQLEGLRKVGDPNALATRYYSHGIDEVIFMDAVASYYDRNNLSDIIRLACQNVHIPITVGGGIRTLDDISRALVDGADKVAINTAAIRSPRFIREAATVFGSQCIVASIEAKKSDTGWSCYFDNGREQGPINIFEWIKTLEDLGAGEIMLTSVDREGTQKGLDLDLLSQVGEMCSLPLIASGGVGTVEDLVSGMLVNGVDAVAVASVLHYGKCDVEEMKEAIASNGVLVRR